MPRRADYQPIYLDDVNLERYGYSHGVLEPFAGAIHFFGTIPLLPYKAGIHPPTEQMYSLGYYRPGSPAPIRPVVWVGAGEVPYSRPPPSAPSLPGFPRASSIRNGGPVGQGDSSCQAGETWLRVQPKAKRAGHQAPINSAAQ